MSRESQTIFKQQIILSKKRNKNLKVKNLPKWLIPTSQYRELRKAVLSLLNRYIEITNTVIIPQLEIWFKESEQIKNDQWEEELELINEEQFETIQEEEKPRLKRTLLTIAVFVLGFNLKQWQKTVNKQFDFEPFTFEGWRDPLLNAWVVRNVSLIKGLTDEYRKKIVDTILEGNRKGLSVNELKKNLKQINNTFSNYRTDLIARDQINKLNSQLSAQRQRDAGVETYYWRNSGDVRVRGNPSGKFPNSRTNHWIMEDILCRWDNPLVYSKDNGATWINRTSEMPKVHPGEEIGCRCFGESNFEPLVKEVNSTQESLLG